MHILVVEDNIDIGSAITKYLEASHHKVQRYTKWKDALAYMENQRVDCILLDWMLPDMSWINICSAIKAKKDIPIIMTTAKGQIEDKVEGFSCGADDYLTKPFDLKELELRINAVTGRKQKNTVFHRNTISFDVEAKQVFDGNKEIWLSNTEFLILEALFNQQGIALSRSDLLEEIRGEESVWDNDNKLDVYISMIRKKLGKEIIQTIKGFGYKIGE